MRSHGMPLILTEAEHWALLILAQPKLYSPRGRIALLTI